MSIFEFNKNHNTIIINSSKSSLDSIRFYECKKVFNTLKEYSVNDLSKVSNNFFEDRLYIYENSNLENLGYAINSLHNSNSYLIIFGSIENDQYIDKELVSYYGKISLNKETFKEYVNLIISQLQLNSIENYEEIYSMYRKYFKSEYLEEALTYLPTIIVNSQYASNIPLHIKGYTATLELSELFYYFLFSRKKEVEYYKLYNHLLKLESGEEIIDSIYKVIDIFMKTKYFNISQDTYFNKQIVKFDSMANVTLLKVIIELNNHYKEIIDCPLVGLQKYLNSLLIYAR